MTCETYLG